MSAAPAIPEAEHIPTIQSLSLWRGRPEIAPLHGGLSNQSYTATDETGRYVVRFGVDFPFHHVSRDREVIATQAAHAAGFAPELVYHAPGIMVSRFIAGKTYTAEDVQQNIGKVVGLVRRFHRDMATHIHGSGFAFWVFHVIRDYARTLAKGDHRMRDRLGEFTEIGNALEAVQIPLPVTIGHHDILPANLIDDGQKLWLIDFEYAGFGTGMFDLANMTSNADFTPEQADEALALYFDHTPDDGTIRAHRAMECASLLREAMWSMVSELFMTTPGIDYVAYSGEILAKTEAALDVYQTRFGKLI
ncbi:MAG: choline/ethanolamine kinase family protein [Pseudomonadota bacterium]